MDKELVWKTTSQYTWEARVLVNNIPLVSCKIIKMGSQHYKAYVNGVSVHEGISLSNAASACQRIWELMVTACCGLYNEWHKSPEEVIH